MPRGRLGSISKLAEGKFRIRVQRGRKLDGSPNVHDETYYGTEEQAKLRAAQIARDMGRRVQSADLTLAEYYYNVFRPGQSVRGKQRAANTLEMYDSQMERNVLPLLGSVYLNDLTHAMIRNCVLQASSPSGTKTVLRAVLRAAYDDELLQEKPFDRRITTSAQSRPKHAPWSRFEVSQALQLFQGQDEELEAYLILGLSGLSKEEVLGVRPCDIIRQSVYSYVTGEQVETLVVNVSQAYTDLGGVSDLKNEHRERIVPVLAPSRTRLEYLVPRLQQDPLERLICCRGDVLYKRWKAQLKRLDLRYIPPKLLRHTSDTLALASGVSSDLNDKMHGRTQSQTTYANYFRPDLGLMEHASAQIGAILDPYPSETVEKKQSGDMH